MQHAGMQREETKQRKMQGWDGGSCNVVDQHSAFTGRRNSGAAAKGRAAAQSEKGRGDNNGWTCARHTQMEMVRGLILGDVTTSCSACFTSAKLTPSAAAGLAVNTKQVRSDFSEQCRVEMRADAG